MADDVVADVACPSPGLAAPWSSTTIASPNVEGSRGAAVEEEEGIGKEAGAGGAGAARDSRWSRKMSFLLRAVISRESLIRRSRLSVYSRNYQRKSARLKRSGTGKERRALRLEKDGREHRGGIGRW
jgi:hypothetical protein